MPCRVRIFRIWAGASKVRCCGCSSAAAALLRAMSDPPRSRLAGGDRGTGLDRFRLHVRGILFVCGIRRAKEQELRDDDLDRRADHPVAVRIRARLQATLDEEGLALRAVGADRLRLPVEEDEPEPLDRFLPL